MAKGMYVGISGKARKIKKGYVGIGGKARKIKKAYIGVNGKARLCYRMPDKVVRPVKNISIYDKNAFIEKAVSFSKRAVFISYMDYVANTYDESLSLNTFRIQEKRSNFNATPLTNPDTKQSFLFIGGGDYGSIRLITVDVFDTSFVRYGGVSLTIARRDLSAATSNGYALFAGGVTDSSLSKHVDIYNSSLTRFTTTLVRPKVDISSISTQNDTYAVFAGGNIGYSENITTDEIEVFHTTTRINTPSLSSKRRYVQSALIDGYSMFAGGIINEDKTSTASDTVDCYTASMTRYRTVRLSLARYKMASVTLDDRYALFVGGNGDNGTSSSLVDVFDRQFVRANGPTVGVTESSFVGATVGDYGLFSHYNSTYKTRISCYTLE